MNVDGGCVMTRRTQTDNRDKLYEEGVWNLLVHRPNQFIQSARSGSFSGFYGKVNPLLASVEKGSVSRKVQGGATARGRGGGGSCPFTAWK